MNKSMSQKIKLILADDHAVVSLGIKLALSQYSEFEVVGVADNSTALVDLLGNQQCDVLLTDYVMPGGAYGDGLGLLQFLRRRYPHVQIVVLTMVENYPTLSNIMKIGVNVIVAKQDNLTHVAEALKSASVKKSYYSPGISAILDAATARVGDLKLEASLTKREIEVLRLYLSGLSVSDIAKQLRRSVKTSSAQKMSIMRKLGITRDADLLRYGLDNGLISDIPNADGNSNDS